MINTECKIPFVSVIIPTRNRAQLLRRAITSVMKQTYTNFEILVVDDASDDLTKESVYSFDEKRIRYLFHQVNKHASAARNTGIRNSQGQLISFLDDDDEWLPTKLEKQVSLLQQSPIDVAMVYTWMEYVDADLSVISQERPQLRGYVFDQLLHSQRLGNSSTLLVRSSAVTDIGGFDEDLRRGNDGDFIRRICLNNKVDVVPEILVRLHVGHGNRISNRTKQGLKEEIDTLQVRLEKFPAKFQEFPKSHASILRQLALDHAGLGHRLVALLLFFRSFRLDPWNMSIIKSLVKWALGRY